MKAAIIEKVDKLVVKEIPEPKIGDYNALVKILTCSICNGTDTSIIKGNFSRIDASKYPGVLGHESVGYVCEIGNKVQNFKKGDLVLRPMAVEPGQNIAGYSSLFGGFAEYGTITDAEALKNDIAPRNLPFIHPMNFMQQVLPKNINPDWGGVIITFKECLSWMKRIGVKNGDSILIIGTGPVALAMIQASRLLGACPIINVGRRDEACSRAIKFGSHYSINSLKNSIENELDKILEGKGVQYIALAISDYTFLQQGSDLLSKDGVIGIYGIAPQNRAFLNWNNPNWALKILNPDEASAHQQVIDAWRAGFIDFSRYITAKIELSEINDGFQLIWNNKNMIKVVVRC
jgi:threonine dehydrogenase-like Zn-dependent dehydrogenase